MSDSLQQRLERLHQELDRRPELDDESRQLLAQIELDIQRLQAEGREGPMDAINAQLLMIEQDHPAVGLALRETINALARMGV